MRYIPIQQNTPAWHAWRKQGIGASDAATILGLSPFKTAARLFAEMTGEAEPEDATFAMARGLRLEPMARREYERRYRLGMEPCCGEHDARPWMRASFDGLDLLGTTILEIKWPKWELHEQALDGHVPDYYWPQVQHQLAVSGAAECHYWSCSDNKKFQAEDCFVLVRSKPDESDILDLIAAELEFWQRVQAARTGKAKVG